MSKLKSQSSTALSTDTNHLAKIIQSVFPWSNSQGKIRSHNDVMISIAKEKKIPEKYVSYIQLGSFLSLWPIT